MKKETPNKRLRREIAEVIKNAGEGHIPSSYSIIDILAVLYGKFLKFDAKNPQWEERDYFILSKGHGCTALYVVLKEHNFITEKDLKEKSKEYAILGGHPDETKIPGVEASTGSLGHGIAMAMGIAMGLRIKNKKNRVIALVGDGECNEGTIWETALVANHIKLGNFCVIIDNNGSTNNILSMPNFRQKWEAFGWEAYDVNGHDPEELLAALNSIKFEFNARPKVIIANTIKGKGVSFMENHGLWHHKLPTDEEMELIRDELK